MTFRPMSALCILLLAGCTSSEPQNASYVPLAEEMATMPNPPPTQAPYDRAGQVLPSDAAAAVALQPSCHTVNNVTLCDVPADPTVDDTLYTN